MELPTKKSSGWKSIEDVQLGEGYPPKEYYTHANFIQDGELAGLIGLIESNASETQLDKYLVEHTGLWDNFFPHTGNHGIWVIPKQKIKVKMGNQSRGLIPDFIIATKNSDGFQYWVVELKGTNQNLLTINAANELYFSTEGNKGMSQLIEYMDYCAKYQSKLRDEFNFPDFREPRGILVIGRETEFSNNDHKREFKAAWNRLNSKIEIRTYDSLIRRA